MQTQVFPAVAVAIFNEKGEILLQKRRDSGRWCVLSGHVEFGESVEDAVLREIREETGVAGQVMRFIGVCSSPGSQTYQRQNERTQYVTSYFEARLLEPIPEDYPRSETIALQFFSPYALPAPLEQMHPHWLTHAVNRDLPVFID